MKDADRSALRASNVINITLKQVLSAQGDKHIKDAFMFKNNTYKVSLIYGGKIILASETLHSRIKLYTRDLHPFLIDDKHRLDRQISLCVM